jgi:hypothetical protein
MTGTYTNQDSKCVMTITNLDSSNGIISGSVNIGGANHPINGQCNTSHIAPSWIFFLTGASDANPNNYRIGISGSWNGVDAYAEITVSIAYTEGNTTSISGRFTKS